MQPSQNEKLNFAARLALSFVRKKALSFLILLTILTGGITSYIIAPKSANPLVDQAVFSITWQWPGATAEEVENFLTKKLEQTLGDLKGVDSIESQSIDGGMAIVMVKFKVGLSVEEKKAEVLTQIAGLENVAQGYGIASPVIVNIGNLSAITYGFTSNILTQDQLRTKIVELQDKINLVENVANVQVIGGEPRSLRVELAPDKMQLRKVSPGEIFDAIQATNLKVFVGQVDNLQHYYDIEVNGLISSVENARKILVAPGIYLEDVANVFQGDEALNSMVETYRNGRFIPAVYLSIGQVDDSNIMQISSDVEKLIETEWEKSEYKNIQKQLYYDDGDEASENTNGLIQDLFASVLTVLIVLLLFLQIRPALTVGLTIPVSIIFSFCCVYFSGETFNKVTFFAFIVALGLLVDSATVVVENIFRHLQNGETKLSAVKNGVNEVGIGLTMSTVTTVIVFLPIGTIGGYLGGFIFPMALFVPILLILAYLIAITLAPFLASLILRENCSSVKSSKNKKHSSLIEFIRYLYARLLKKILDSNFLQFCFLICVVGGISFAFFLFYAGYVKETTVPADEPYEYYVHVDTLPGDSLLKTRKVVEEIVPILSKNPRTKTLQIYSAIVPILDLNETSYGGHQRGKQNQATIRVGLYPKKDLVDSEDIKAEILEEHAVERARRQLKESSVLQEFRKQGVQILVLNEIWATPAVASLELEVKGDDKTIRQKITEDLLDFLSQTVGVVHLTQSEKNPYPRFIYEVDTDKALASGLTTYVVAETLQIALGGKSAGLFHQVDTLEPGFIELNFAREDKNQLADFSQIYLKNQMGQMVPLDSVIVKRETRNESIRLRDNRQPVNKIQVYLQGRDAKEVVPDLTDFMRTYQFPEKGVLINSDKYGAEFKTVQGEGYKIEYEGEWGQNERGIDSVYIAMVVAFFLVYCVLVFQFSSFVMPLIIMSTIPLGFIGIYPGFVLLYSLEGTKVGVTGIVGIIALIGIVVNNSIMLIEYFDILRSRGLKIKEALIEAGKTRFRPIILTSLTTILGMIRMISDPVWSGLAWTVTFGLSVSVLITIFLVPVLYNLIRPKRN